MTTTNITLQLKDILLLRQELFLVLLIVFLLLLKIFSGVRKSKKIVIPAINILLCINLGLGFIGSNSGDLFGSMFQNSMLIMFEKTLLNLGLLIVSLQGSRWLKKNKNEAEYFILLLSIVLGMDFMLSSGHMLIFYLGLELASIPLCVLAGYNQDDRRSSESALKLSLTSGFSSAILLMGISLLYGSTGTLAFSSIASGIGFSPITKLAFILLFSGLAFKISIVPFHLWTADVYEGAPVNATSFFSVVSKAASVMMLVTILFKVFPSFSANWMLILEILAVITMLVGNLFAIRQGNLKRFLAFSSIAQAGYILLGIASGSATGDASVMFFILVYIFSNLAAFGVISLIADETGKERLESIKGLYKSNPFFALVLMLSMLSLAGVPPTAGFFGKFFLISSIAVKGNFILVFIASINMVISMYYYMRVVKTVFVDIPTESIRKINGNIYSGIGLFICTAGILLAGFIPQVFEYIHQLSFGL